MSNILREENINKNPHSQVGYGFFDRDKVYIFDLLFALIQRDIQVKYKGSWLGVGWSLLNPLLRLMVYRFIFGTILDLKVPNFTTHIFIGIITITWFSGSITQATNGIVGNRSLVKKPGFPSWILPLIPILSHAYHFLITLPILFVVILFDGGSVSAHILHLPIVFIVQLVFSLSLTYWTATVTVFFRDAKYLLDILFRMLFYATPIIYSIDQVPEQYLPFFLANPLHHLIDGYRNILMHGMAPNYTSLAVMSLVSIVLLLLGYKIFQYGLDFAVEEI